MDRQSEFFLAWGIASIFLGIGLLMSVMQAFAPAGTNPILYVGFAIINFIFAAGAIRVVDLSPDDEHDPGMD